MAMIDLADCFNEDGSEKQDWKHEDMSGRPVPKGVRVILDSGVEIPCEVRYDGHSERDKRFRRYVITAEIDWLKHHIQTIVIDENPLDVHLIVQFPDSLDSEHREEHMRWLAEVKTLVRKTV